MIGTDVYIHPSAFVDEPADIGPRTKIWHCSHVLGGARIGADCNLGQNVYVAATARLGCNVKVQNNVSIYDGVELEDDVFCGPSCVFTNVANPRSQRRGAFDKTIVRRGATIGANATIVCGTVIGRYAFIAAGAVLTRQTVPDYALMTGVPARRTGWVGRHGSRLKPSGEDGRWLCGESNWIYRELSSSKLQCIGHDEEEPL